MYNSEFVSYNLYSKISTILVETAMHTSVCLSIHVAIEM